MRWSEREYPSVPVNPHSVAAILEDINVWSFAEVERGELHYDRMKYVVKEQSRNEVVVTVWADKDDILANLGDCRFLEREQWVCEDWCWQDELPLLLDAVDALADNGYTTQLIPPIGCNEAAGCDSGRLIVTRRGHAPLPGGVKVLTEEELAER